MKQRFFFRIGDDYTYMDKNGYVSHESYAVMIKSLGYYFLEANIIEKINANEEGYFDFNKSLVDIGCEIGEYCEWTKFAYYYMFDGNRDKITIANFNMLIREREDICESHVALLGDRVEDIPYDGFTGDAYADPKNVKMVKTTTLDSFDINNVGLIKVDVEGMEEKVLRGGVGTIVRNGYPPILFELWDPEKTGFDRERYDSLVNFIQGLGYEILWNWGDEQTHLAVKK